MIRTILALHKLRRVYSQRRDRGRGVVVRELGAGAESLVDGGVGERDQEARGEARVCLCPVLGGEKQRCQ